MSVDRPTFSESWYRIDGLRPRLRSTAQTFRQHYRGRMWYVIRDPSNNQFFRLNQASYHFIGLLDGRRTVADAWKLGNEQLGDHAPTQGEAIRLLGQLYTANLLQAELPADAQGMFERYRKRVRRELGGYFLNLLFPRLPLLNPEGFLESFVGVVGWIFSWWGLALWAVWIGLGFWFLTGHWQELLSAGNPQSLLRTENLLLLYVAFALIKAIHEFGHGFACKKFGKADGSGGEVHTMGIMLLVFMPTPYVDASSSWAFRSRWHRAIVGAAGMYVELAIAAGAAMLWASTGPGALHDICYNAMFVASVSTILFNANPLLRYDGYYILSDLLEIPNLAQRSKEYLYYLVRKYAYGVRNPQSPAHSRGERFWFAVYAVSSTIYRVLVSVAIMLFVADKLFFVGALMAVASVVGWVGYPVGKFIHYLVTSEELTRTRPRALAVTLACVAVLGGFIGLVPVPDRDRAEGVVEPVGFQFVAMAADGFIDRVLPSGQGVAPDGKTVLVAAHNYELESQLAQVEADLQLTRTKRDQALTKEPATAQALDDKIASLQFRANHLREQLTKLALTPPLAGTWVSPEIENLVGSYKKQGEQVGMVATIDQLHLRAIASQQLGPRIREEVGVGKKVEVRVRGYPDLWFEGTIEKILPAGQDRLPTAALGYGGGGALPVAQDDKNDSKGLKAAEPFFEVRITPGPRVQPSVWTSPSRWFRPATWFARRADASAPTPPLFSGQRVMVRFDMPSRPLAAQWWRSLRQLLQKRFQM